MRTLLNIINTIWKILYSVKLTLFLLILLALSSVFGTLIPQNEEAVHLAERLSPAMGRLFASLQLFDLYHSFWFRLIILLLVLNLIACSINRFPATLRLFRIKPKPDRPKSFENLHEDRDFTANGNLEPVTEKVKSALESRYKEISAKNTPEGNYFYIDKGRYSLFGVYLVHLSVFFILAGAIIGSRLGFNGYVNILEGESTDSITLRKSQAKKYLDFIVHCDEFTIDFYENGMPKEYRSSLRFFVDNKEAYNGLLRVNHPITFRGITFYQASYGSIPGDSARIKIFSSDTQTLQKQEIKHGVPVSLPDGKGEFILADIRDNFMRMGPAVSIIIRDSQDEAKQIWLFRDHEQIQEQIPEMFTDYPRFNPSIYKPFTFSLENIDQKYYTGIQVNRDPGIAFVYAGFSIIIIGLFITFFLSRRRIWVRIIDKNNTVHVQVAGTSNKNPVGLERELDRITKHLQREI